MYQDISSAVEALQFHSNTQWVNHLLPVKGVSGSRPVDAPTLTMELGSPFSAVLLHW
jgi:hypothetical protein